MGDGSPSLVLSQPDHVAGLGRTSSGSRAKSITSRTRPRVRRAVSDFKSQIGANASWTALASIWLTGRSRNAFGRLSSVWRHCRSCLALFHTPLRSCLAMKSSAAPAKVLAGATAAGLRMAAGSTGRPLVEHRSRLGRERALFFEIVPRRRA